MPLVTQLMNYAFDIETVPKRFGILDAALVPWLHKLSASQCSVVYEHILGEFYCIGYINFRLLRVPCCFVVYDYLFAKSIQSAFLLCLFIYFIHSQPETIK